MLGFNDGCFSIVQFNLSVSSLVRSIRALDEAAISRLRAILVRGSRDFPI